MNKSEKDMLAATDRHGNNTMRDQVRFLIAILE